MNESGLQIAVANYIRLKYPQVLFHSDFGSGVKLTKMQAIRQKRQNGGRRAWPDMFIAEPKNGKHGLFIELKKEGVKIFTKKGTLVANEHIREQYDVLQELDKAGYIAVFACGIDEARAIIDEYLG